jgi:hypothetical protein
MAQKVQVLLVCDLHDNDTEGTETVTFSLDGAAYEIDVCDKHGTALRNAFATYVGAARRAGRSTTVKRGRPAKVVSDKDRTTAIREWARKNGYKVSERGRLSAAVIAAYDAAH